MATAAPGQLTAQQLMDIRLNDKLISPKQFYLFGTPISKSLSPAMHNAAYTALLLPHQYNLAESADVASYENIIKGKNFGGASVTIPHKETIIPFLDEIVGAAKDIGAVNTIVPVQLSENGKRLSTENKIALERLREVERENDDLKSVLEELRSDKRALDDSVRGNSGDNEKILILEANILDLRDSLDRTKQECAELLSSRKELEQERQKSISLQKVALYIL
jgi:Skp family chaperone for outer membrane proteins